MFSFSDIISDEVGKMSLSDRASALRRAGHGVAIYETERQLNDYLFLYGEIHVAKMRRFLASVPFDEFIDDGLCIVDWGCGQGLATACTLDAIAQRDIRPVVRCVRLIELSKVALARASRVLAKYPQPRDIRLLNWDLDELSRTGLGLPCGAPVLHLFSNILDVESIDLEKLAEVFQRCTARHPTYVLSVSPKYPLERAMRLKKFFSMVSGEHPIDFSMQSLQVPDAKYYPFPTCSCYGILYRVAESSAKDASPFVPDPKFSLDELIAYAAADMAEEIIAAVRGVDVNGVDMDGYTPLIYAAKYGATSSLQVLLSAGANKDARNGKGATALYFAAKGGHLDCVKALIQNGANMEIGTYITRMTPYMVAKKYGRNDVSAFLEQSGANTKARDYRGRLA